MRFEGVLLLEPIPPRPFVKFVNNASKTAGADRASTRTKNMPVPGRNDDDDDDDNNDAADDEEEEQEEENHYDDDGSDNDDDAVLQTGRKKRKQGVSTLDITLVSMNRIFDIDYNIS